MLRRALESLLLAILTPKRRAPPPPEPFLGLGTQTIHEMSSIFPPGVDVERILEMNRECLGSDAKFAVSTLPNGNVKIELLPPPGGLVVKRGKPNRLGD